MRHAPVFLCDTLRHLVRLRDALDHDQASGDFKMQRRLRFNEIYISSMCGRSPKSVGILRQSTCLDELVAPV